MELELFFPSKSHLRIALRDGDTVLEVEERAFHKDLDVVLIESVDKIFQRARITSTTVRSVSIRGVLDKKSLAYTIVRAWIAGMALSEKSE